MTEFLINDDWVLNRVSKESSSFKNWIDNIVSQVEKNLENTDTTLSEKELEEFDKIKGKLPELVTIDEKIVKAKNAINNFKELPGGEKISGFMSNFANRIQKKVEQTLQNSKYLGEDSEYFEFNLDFLTGKRKTLSEALYDVAIDRGIKSKGILYLIQSLPDLESFLYSTSAGKFYRDHTEHQLRVAVLGDFLLEQDLGSGNLLNHIAEITEIKKSTLKEQIWWITGLIHDIGYPLQKMTTSINYALLNQILKCYPMIDLDVVPMEVNLSYKKNDQKEYLKLLEEGLTKEAIALIRNGAGLNLETTPIPDIQHFSSEKINIPYHYKSPISLDHGVIGALALLKSLGTIDEIKEKKDELQGYLKAAQAIALHNFKNNLKDFTFDDNPLAFLLILIDEMQEWGRPIPIQIRDSYFTTELQKITLLDEVLLTIDEIEWLMIYKKMKAKELINFKFPILCNAKKEAFNRLKRGKEFPEQRVILQDIDIGKDSSKNQSLDTKSIQGYIAESIKKSVKKEKTPQELESKRQKAKIGTESMKQELAIKDDNSKKAETERLLAEFYIVI